MENPGAKNISPESFPEWRKYEIPRTSSKIRVKNGTPLYYLNPSFFNDLEFRSLIENDFEALYNQYRITQGIYQRSDPIFFLSDLFISRVSVRDVDYDLYDILHTAVTKVSNSIFFESSLRGANSSKIGQPLISAPTTAWTLNRPYIVSLAELDKNPSVKTIWLDRQLKRYTAFRLPPSQHHIARWFLVRNDQLEVTVLKMPDTKMPNTMNTQSLRRFQQKLSEAMIDATNIALDA